MNISAECVKRHQQQHSSNLSSATLTTTATITNSSKKGCSSHAFAAGASFEKHLEGVARSGSAAEDSLYME